MATKFKPCGNPPLTDNEIGMVECCPNCGHENWYRSNVFAWKVCNECGTIHKPCSMCDHDTCVCDKCPLGPDRDAKVVPKDANAVFRGKYRTAVLFPRNAPVVLKGRNYDMCVDITDTTVDMEKHNIKYEY